MDEKAKVTKKCVMKHYKKRLKASQIENITNYLEKKEIDAEIWKKSQNIKKYY